MTVDQALDLAGQFEQAGKPADAQSVYLQILHAFPAHARARMLLGNLQLRAGNVDEAIELLDRARVDDPGIVEAWNSLVVAWMRKGAWEKAVEMGRQAVVLKPDFAHAHYNLGLALYRGQLVEEAVESHQRCLALLPNFASAYSDLGNALRDLGRLDEAVAALGRAIELSPDLAVAHHNLGQVYLLRGDYLKGWDECEWRWRIPELTIFEQQFPQPRWDGGDLTGRRILIRAEQGFGDAIQFARFLPMVAARGGTVILTCRAELKRLMPSIDGIQGVMTHGDPLVPFDVQCSLMDLPRLFGTTVSTIPATVPYLRADPELVDAWKKRLEATTTALKIGLAWAGAPDAPMPQRWLKLAELGPIMRVGGVQCFSLQKGWGADEIRELPAGMNLVDWTDQLADFAETAAFIECLDLIISVDTAVAHLAGALGKQAWVLIPSSPDWRWMLDRSDSPWYPTARLFRQRVRGGWGHPVDEMSAALRDMVR